jgi:hypothetical protein
MKGRPWVLTLLSVSFVVFAMSPLLSVLHDYGTSGLSPSSLLQVLGAEDWAVLGLGTMGAVLAWHASSILTLFLPLLSMLAVWEGYLVYDDSMDLARATPQTIACAIFLAMQFLWLLPRPRQALLDPHKRWWKTPPRALACAAALVRTGTGEDYASTVRNLSHKGLLLDLHEGGEGDPLKPGQIIDIRFLLGPLSVVQVRAEVVRRQARMPRNDRRKQDPGVQFGLRFLPLTSSAKTQIERYMEAHQAA